MEAQKSSSRERYRAPGWLHTVAPGNGPETGSESDKASHDCPARTHQTPEIHTLSQYPGKVYAQ